jgi:tetratricopeptide (TPR) repeat protein
MRMKKLRPALAACALLMLATASASAQVDRIEGDVKKQGTGEPIPNALVQIVRMDIRGNYDVKTDKKGHFLHAGVPLVGTYTVLVSADGFAPTFATGVKPGREPLTFDLLPGDGKKLTIDDVKKAQASAPPAKSGGSGGAPQVSEAERKKQLEEYEKIKAKNEKMKTDFEAMKKHFETGQQLAANKDYAGAINSFNEAIKLDAEQHPIFANLALALYNRGATQLNAGQRDPAKQDFTDSVSAAEKAFQLLEAPAQGGDPAKPADPLKLKKDKSLYLKIKADAEAVLARRFSDGAAAEAANKDYKAAAELSDDPAAKRSYLLKGAEALRESNKTAEAITAYQEILQTDPDNVEALYNLGLAYANNEKTWQDSANTLQRFVDKAPATDPRVAEAKAVIGELIKGNNITPPKPYADTKGKADPKRRKP